MWTTLIELVSPLTSLHTRTQFSLFLQMTLTPMPQVKMTINRGVDGVVELGVLGTHGGL